MTVINFVLLAAGSLSIVLGAPTPSRLSTGVGMIDKRDGTFVPYQRGSRDVYQMYTGNGQAFPDISEWVSTFNEMFANNNDIFKSGCIQYGVAINSNQEILDIASGIKQVAGETSVDARFILAILLQESSGCVRAPTSNGGVRNPGLMQDHDGAATCNEAGVIQNPCPSSTITQMIREGVAGTSRGGIHGDGLVQTLAQAPSPGSAKYYQAARIYNSGSIAPSGDLGAGIATHCYASDVANRLTGWVLAQKSCMLDGTPALAPAPRPAVPVAAPIIAAPGNSHKATSSKMAPGVTTECAQYYTVQGGDYCFLIHDKFGISFDKLRTLNTGLDGACSNLWKGYDYCVKGLW